MSERLYGRLPLHLRRQDHAQGEPLRALLGVIEEQLQALDDDIAGTYRDWFVETCDPDRLPYLADLLGIDGIRDVNARQRFSLRSYVGRTIAFRRRKGTLGVIEDLARSTTGWPTRAVEMFQRLDTTQHLDHIRLHAPRTADMREAHRMDLVDGPFGPEVHTAEVRTAEGADGRYNLPNIALFFWRVDEHPVVGSLAHSLTDGTEPPDVTRYTFDPAGRDVVLFNRRNAEDEIAHLAEESDMPGPLRARALGEALAHVDPERAGAPYFSETRRAFEVWVDGVRKTADELRIFTPYETEPAVDAWSEMLPPPDTVLIDPVRGRIVVHVEPGDPAPTEVRVAYHYGAPDWLGAGPYPRPELEDDLAARAEPDWQIGVSATIAPEPGVVVGTLQEAVTAWRNAVTNDGARTGRILVMDSSTYVETLSGATSILVPADGHLVLAAAGWDSREKGDLDADGLRPHIRGDLHVEGSAPGPDQQKGEIRLDGLQVEGSVVVDPGDLGELHLHSCTVIPELGGLRVEPHTGDPITTGNAELCVRLTASIVGDLDAPETVAQLVAERSVLGALEVPGAKAQIDECTVLREVDVRVLSANNSLFLETVEVRQRQAGCLRYCYTPPTSRTPRRFRCQPDTAVASAPDTPEETTLRRVVPAFSSLVSHHPRYAQLRRLCPPEIREGAEGGSEMGVYHSLQHPTRVANLRLALDQYARVGLEHGFFFVT